MVYSAKCSFPLHAPSWAAISKPQWPVEEMIRADLNSGLINEVLGVSGPLELRSVENEDGYGKQIADDHSYFFLRALQMHPRRTDAVLSFLIRDEQGFGHLRSRRLSLPAEAGDGQRKRLYAVDEEAIKIWKEYGDGFGLYRNHVRRVSFDDGAKVYSAYLKYTPAIEAESLGRRCLKMVGLRVPPLFLSSAPNAFWTPSIAGRAFRPMTVNQLELMQIGGALAVMFVFANDDLHSENVVLDEEGACYTDLECFGLPFPSNGIDRRTPESNFIKLVNRMLDGIFGEGKSNGMSRDAQPHLVSGFNQTMDLPLSSPEIVDRMISTAADTFGARMVITRTMRYMRGFGMLRGIPHYTVIVSREEFRNTVRMRLDMARAAMKRDDLVWDYRPSVFFKLSSCSDGGA